MPDLADGESLEMQGSGAKPYVLKNTGGVYSCSCPAWRNQSVAIERRTCKHLKKLRGEAVELARLVAVTGGETGGLQPGDSRSDVTDGGETGGAERGPGVELLLAEAWTGETDITGWWMSEKLDGVRAYWNGSTFLSRLGNEFLAPEWFTAGLPEHPLDGELWLGRKAFQRAVSIVRRRDRSEHWRELKYVVFDVPGMEAPFEDRTGHLTDLLTRSPLEFVRPHPQTLCRGAEHLADELARLATLGGEGVMLRQPGSRYVAGRSATLLKVKQFLEGEARVVEHQAGAGRHKGRLGALVCELADGKRFSIGTGFSDAERQSPPGVGTVIQFRYQELSEGGIPRFPAYLGARVDVVAGSTAESLARAETPRRSQRGQLVAGAGQRGSETVESNQPGGGGREGPEAGKGEGCEAGSGGGGLRRFECRDGGSSKFWEVEVRGEVVAVRYGKLGTAGQESEKHFSSPDKATAHAGKLIGEKTGKGYVEVGARGE